MDHIYYSKNVLDAGTLNNLQELCLEKFKDIPTYNFARKTEEPKNYLEEVIRDLIGYDNHVEYWVRDSLEATLFHVDANELAAKISRAKYNEEDPEMVKEFPLNTHILYIYIDPKMEKGDLILLPNQEYIVGRRILDTDFEPLEGQEMFIIKPETNHMVLFDRPIYHAVSAVENTDVVKHRLALMFSSWRKIPSVYKEHHHWSNDIGTRRTIYNTTGLYEPEPMEFKNFTI